MANLQTEPLAIDQTTIEPHEGPAAQMRLDAAHHASSTPEEPRFGHDEPPLPDGAAEVIEPIVAARLRLQAGQLAGHLKERRRELDRRESELNARLFQLEAELRASKLWLRERQHELAQREAELQSARDELRRQAAGMSAADLAAEDEFAARRQELDEREAALDQRERRLQQSQEEAERRQAQLEREQKQQAERQLDLEAAELAALQRIAAAREAAQSLHRQMLKQLEVRREALKHSQPPSRETAAPAKATEDSLHGSKSAQNESAKKEAAEWLARQQRQWQALSDQQQALRRRAEAEQHRLAARRQHAEEQIARQQAELDERRESLSRRAEAVERLQAEIMLKHREALEMRIVAEQLWSQLGKQMTPQMTQSFAMLRSELTGACRAETARAAEQRQQIRSLAEALDKQQQELRRKRRELERWAARTRSEIEEQAARVVAQELRLDQREAQWCAEQSLLSKGR